MKLTKNTQVLQKVMAFLVSSESNCERKEELLKILHMKLSIHLSNKITAANNQFHRNACSHLHDR